MITVRNMVFLGAGVGIGYLLARKALEDSYQERLDEEIADAKKHYEKKFKEYQVEKAAEAVEDYSGGAISKDVAEAFVKKEMLSIIQESEEEEDDEDEDSEPLVHENVFVISQDEFMESRLGYDQQTLTYYEGDKIVANEREEELSITDVQRTVGIKSLKKFGEMSGGQENVVYVRSHILRVDTELVRSFGSYAEEVKGIVAT